MVPELVLSPFTLAGRERVEPISSSSRKQKEVWPEHQKGVIGAKTTLAILSTDIKRNRLSLDTLVCLCVYVHNKTISLCNWSSPVRQMGMKGKKRESRRAVVASQSFSNTGQYNVSRFKGRTYGSISMD